MDRGITILFILIFVIICASLGALALFMYQSYVAPAPADTTTDQESAALTQSEQQELAKLRQLESDAVSSIMVFGNVSQINGNEITLATKTVNILVPLTTDAKIYTTDKTGKQVETQISSITAGKSIQIAVRLLPTGDMIGYSALIVQ